MGTNKRYAHRIDDAMEQRMLESFATTKGPLQTVSPAELELDRLPLTVDPQPKKVRAWVRFGAKHAQVDAELLRWTTKACGIRFEVRGKCSTAGCGVMQSSWRSRAATDEHPTWACTPARVSRHHDRFVHQWQIFFCSCNTSAFAGHYLDDGGGWPFLGGWRPDDNAHD